MANTVESCPFLASKKCALGFPAVYNSNTRSMETPPGCYLRGAEVTRSGCIVPSTSRIVKVTSFLDESRISITTEVFGSSKQIELYGIPVETLKRLG